MWESINKQHYYYYHVCIKERHVLNLLTYKFSTSRYSVLDHLFTIRSNI